MHNRMMINMLGIIYYPYIQRDFWNHYSFTAYAMSPAAPGLGIAE
jgi:hypothetical protein